MKRALLAAAILTSAPALAGYNEPTISPPKIISNSMMITEPGHYVITGENLTITLSPSAAVVYIKDEIGTSTVAATIDGSADGATFTVAYEAFTLVYSQAQNQWLQY